MGGLKGGRDWTYCISSHKERDTKGGGRVREFDSGKKVKKKLGGRI